MTELQMLSKERGNYWFALDVPLNCKNVISSYRAIKSNWQDTFFMKFILNVGNDYLKVTEQQ